jgi:hypothetical protein
MTTPGRQPPTHPRVTAAVLMLAVSALLVLLAVSSL